MCGCTIDRVGEHNDGDSDQLGVYNEFCHLVSIETSSKMIIQIIPGTKHQILKFHRRKASKAAASNVGKIQWERGHN